MTAAESNLEHEEQAIVLKGEEADTTVEVTVHVRPETTGYIGRFSAAEESLVLEWEQTEYEVTSGGRQEVTSRQRVAQIPIGDLIAKVGSVEKLAEAKLIVVDLDSGLWRLQLMDNTLWQPLLFDLQTKRVVYKP